MRRPPERLTTTAEVDGDGDGVADSMDRRLAAAEDFDGFQDDDGCPEADNDGDGIPDLVDLCPCVPENVNSYEDMDGCPECGSILQVDDSVRMDVVVVFEQDSAQLTASAESLVQEIAQAFAQYEHLQLVAVQGHAIQSEPRAAHLADQRAAVVITALVQHGVASERLVRESLAAEHPLEDGANASALERSRRVEFEVREHAIPPQAPCGDDVPIVRGCGGG